MNPARFKDCHAILDPEQGLGGVDLRQQEACPSAIARMDCE
jgi:hypothetical protein